MTRASGPSTIPPAQLPQRECFKSEHHRLGLGRVTRSASKISQIIRKWDGVSTRILLIDDDVIEAEYTLRMLQREHPDALFDHVRDGIEGLAFLRAEGEFAEAQPPCLILLDLHMPRMDGRSFLKAIRADKSLQRIPVAVLLASQELSATIERDGLNVDAHLVKPIDGDELMKVLRRLGIVRG